MTKFEPTSEMRDSWPEINDKTTVYMVRRLKVELPAIVYRPALEIWTDGIEPTLPYFELARHELILVGDSMCQYVKDIDVLLVYAEEAIAKYDKETLSMFVSIDKELLERIRMGLMEAIVDKDGLDGNEGIALMEAINLALGRNENDYTVNEAETVEGVAPCS